MKAKQSTVLPLKMLHNPVSTPTVYRIRFYARRFLRYFRYSKFQQLCFVILASLFFFNTFISLFSRSSSRRFSKTFNPKHDSSPPTLYEVSTARVNITPHESVFLSGFSTRSSAPSHAALADSSIPLYVRALAFRQTSSSDSSSKSNNSTDVNTGINHSENNNSTSGTTTLLFISMDIIAIPRALSNRLHTHAQSVHSIPPSHLILCASHTHSGPAISDSLSALSPNDSATRAAISRYEDQLEKSIQRVMSTALRPFNSPSSSSSYYSQDTNYAHATVTSFSRSPVTLAVNRRHVHERSFSPGMDRGDTLDTVSVLTFKDAASGDVVAGLFGYSAHPTVLTKGDKYSGDYPAVAAYQLEQMSHYSKQQPLWLFAPGVAGDQNIYPRGTIDLLLSHAHTLASAVRNAVNTKPEEAGGEADVGEQHGEKKDDIISAGSFSDGDIWKENKQQVPKVLSNTSRIVSGDLQARGTIINLPFATRYSTSQLRYRAREGGNAERNAVRVLLPQVSESDGLTASSYEFPVSVWRIGNVVMAFMGGEPTVGYAKLLEAVGVHWVVGYADDVMGYVGTADVIRAGGREGDERAAWYYGLPSKWSVRVEDIIVRAIEKLVDSVTSDGVSGHNYHKNTQEVIK